MIKLSFIHVMECEETNNGCIERSVKKYSLSFLQWSFFRIIKSSIPYRTYAWPYPMTINMFGWVNVTLIIRVSNGFGDENHWTKQANSNEKLTTLLFLVFFYSFYTHTSHLVLSLCALFCFSIFRHLSMIQYVWVCNIWYYWNNIFVFFCFL